MLQTDSHLMRAYARQPVSFVRGRGARLWDEQGVEYLDAIAQGRRPIGDASDAVSSIRPEACRANAERFSIDRIYIPMNVLNAWIRFGGISPLFGEVMRFEGRNRLRSKKRRVVTQ